MDYKQLSDLYNDTGHERTGIILRDGSIIELQNVSTTPEEAFDVKTEDLIVMAEFGRATWHTHPNATAQLSGKDYQSFESWPDHLHFIIGKDGVRCYSYDKTRSAVIETDQNQIAWVLEEALSR